MKLARKSGTKKRKCRPATGQGVQVGERWSAEAVRAIDHWRSKQADLPRRPEAIRRLVELGLAVRQPVRPKSAKTARRAAELATKVIDKHIDPAAPAAERAERKRRILKGPSSFRDIRRDKPE